jgi:hypothetical protein
MKHIALAFVVCVGIASVQAQKGSQPQGQPTQQAVAAPNPNIDMDGYLKISQEAAKHRASRRLTEKDFLKMSAEEGTIVLDARSKEKFDLLHVKGAVNLSFPDITIESLKKTFPDKEARILIYCNNNFENAERAFPSKAPVASLNISTYISLYSYGYRNIYELGPQIDPKKSILPFESNKKGKAK